MGKHFLNRKKGKIWPPSFPNLQVRAGLHQADWLTRREIIRTSVKQVQVDQEQERPGPTRSLVNTTDADGKMLSF
jgi:hypothetical protein